MVSRPWCEESSRFLFHRFKPRMTGDIHELVQHIAASRRVQAYTRWLDLRPPPHVYTVGEVSHSLAIGLQDLFRLMALPNLKTVSLRSLDVAVANDNLHELSRYNGSKTETLELYNVWNLTNCRRTEFRLFWEAFDDVQVVTIYNSAVPPSDINDGPITQLERRLPRLSSLRISAFSSPHIYVWLKHLFVPDMLRKLSISFGNVRLDQVMLYVHQLVAICPNLEDVMLDVQMPHMVLYRERFLNDCESQVLRATVYGY